jgi:hypothetical protein
MAFNWEQVAGVLKQLSLDILIPGATGRCLCGVLSRPHDEPLVVISILRRGRDTASHGLCGTNLAQRVSQSYMNPQLQAAPRLAKLLMELLQRVAGCCDGMAEGGF